MHVKAEDASINGNKLYPCANNRLVDIKEWDKYIVDLDREIYEKSGFWYIGVLRGKCFDETVDMNHLSFNIPDGFSQTPDKLGYYDFNDKLNAYVEILSYDKLIIDAKKRNKVLFDKLGI